MLIAIRFTTGFIVGFEFAPVDGVYFCMYLGICEIAFYNEEALDESKF